VQTLIGQLANLRELLLDGNQVHLLTFSLSHFLTFSLSHPCHALASFLFVP